MSFLYLNSNSERRRSSRSSRRQQRKKFSGTELSCRWEKIEDLSAFNSGTEKRSGKSVLVEQQKSQGVGCRGFRIILDPI